MFKRIKATMMTTMKIMKKMKIKKIQKKNFYHSFKMLPQMSMNAKSSTEILSHNQNYLSPSKIMISVYRHPWLIQFTINQNRNNNKYLLSCNL